MPAPLELQLLSDTEDPYAIFGATGGTRVSRDELEELRRGLTQIAEDQGFPDSVGQEKLNLFDSRSAEFLYETADISAAEAARPEVWSFVGCVLVPHLVRWRFPGTAAGTSSDRYASSRGYIRNAFGRLWWRARLLKDAGAEDSFHLIGELGEDELFQITERPSIRGYPPLAVAIGNVLIQAHAASGRSVARSELVREIVKWLVRYRSIVLFESMTEGDLKYTVNTAAQLALTGMTAGEVGAPEIIPPSRSDGTDGSSDVEVGSTVASDSSGPLTNETLAEYLEFLGLDVRDRLDLGGNLWVLGDSSLDTVMAQLGAKGVQFDYRSEGGRGTGYQSAWLFRAIE